RGTRLVLNKRRIVDAAAAAPTCGSDHEQSPGHVTAVSGGSHTKLPHEAAAAPQSAEQIRGVSSPEHTPSPHSGQVGSQVAITVEVHDGVQMPKQSGSAQPIALSPSPSRPYTHPSRSAGPS